LTDSLETRYPTGKKPIEAASLREMNTEGCVSTEKAWRTCRACRAKEGWRWWVLPMLLTYQHVCWGRGNAGLGLALAEPDAEA